jgi:hypothetical protein
MRTLLTSIAVGLCAACGGGSDRPDSNSELDVVPGGGTAATFATTEALSAGETVETIGVSSEGHLLVVFGGQVHELDGGALSARSLYVGTGDPEAMGAVHRVAPRIGGGAWIGAEAGLFALDDLYTYKVPLLEDAGAIEDAIDISGGALAGLWLATPAGLHRRTGDDVSKLEIAELTGAAHVAIAQDGSFGVAVFGDEIATLEPSADQILVDRPPLDTGAINAIAAGTDAVYLGTANGLFAFTAGATPPWKQYTLAESGSSEVLALAIDGPKNAVWARTAESAVVIEGGAITSFSMTGQGTMSALAIDAFGDVWTANGTELARSATARATQSATFSADVLPWIQDRCSMCHMNQTQNFEDYEVFASVAESALSRVRSGDMPRCTGGLRCPSEQRLEEADYLVLEQWIRDGMPE